MKSNKKIRDTLLMCLLFFVPTCLIFIFYFLQSPIIETSSITEKRFLDFLKQAPRNLSIYIFASMFFGGWLAWSRYRHIELKRHYQEREASETNSDLTPRDWWVSYTFRKRGLALRMGAGFILACIFALLLGGLHLILFGLLEIGVRDQRLARQYAQRAQFEERYGRALQLMAEGRYWFKAATPSLQGSRTTEIHRLAFNKDGTLGVLSWRFGPILVTFDKGRSWREKKNLKLKRGDWVAGVGFSDSEALGMVVSDKGTVFVTSDNGFSWNRLSDVPLKNGDWIGASWFSADAKTALVIGHKGSVRMTTNAGQNWSKNNDVNLNQGASISAAGFSKDGSIGVLGGYKGPVLLTRDRGQSWSSLDGVTLRPTEWLETAVFSADGKYGVIGGVSGSVFVTNDKGYTWKPAGLKLIFGEQLSTAVLSEDGERGLIIGTQGSVFITNDSWTSWAVGTTPGLRKGERIPPESQSAFSRDGLHGVIMGQAGTVLVTVDGGKSWTATYRFDNDYPFRAAASVPFNLDRKVYAVVAVDAGARPYLLEAHASLANWKDWQPTKIVDEMKKNLLISNSQLLKEMATYVTDLDNPGTSSAAPRDENKNSWNDPLDRLMVSRIATMTILFFLVQLLVRLYQYNLRLASFWESRSDAMLLARSFADQKARTFDDLVGSLAPDTYDFKSPPRSMLDHTLGWFRRRHEP